MMKLYVPTSGSTVCEQLSEALWSLSRPPQVRAILDTTRMFPPFVATNGSVWLVVDTEFGIPVHAQAELGGIADILQPWINGGMLPANTNTELAALVESLRGSRLVVWDAFPALFKGQAKTHEQMIDEGFLIQTP